MSIQSFGDDLTEKLFLGIKDKSTSRFPPNLLSATVRKLDIIEYAASLQDLASQPSNRFEKLSGNLKDYWSIRINDQWRIVFRWLDDGPFDVRVIDYH